MRIQRAFQHVVVFGGIVALTCKSLSFICNTINTRGITLILLSL